MLLDALLYWLLNMFDILYLVILDGYYGYLFYVARIYILSRGMVTLEVPYFVDE